MQTLEAEPEGEPGMLSFSPKLLGLWQLSGHISKDILTLTSEGREARWPQEASVTPTQLLWDLQVKV